uniref:Uncharacterized protein n=1 Tax=Bartonella rochalimae ATCC BAA-1498 TaxID=685782 RepID=E6YJZ4_9HYPH|nr:hypothetical protein BARRO_10115 [Bartonella rochalimae ATCC BAA-1498]
MSSPARRALSHNMPGPIRERVFESVPRVKGVMIMIAIKNKGPVNKEVCDNKINLRSRQNSAFILFFS